MAKTTPPKETDLRTTHTWGDASAAPFYNQLVRVNGSTKTGYVEMFGVLTGVTYSRLQNTGHEPTQVIVYMEGQQATTFDATQTAIWIALVNP